MIWQNPWAWLGIVGVVLPIVIHLLGRGHARVLRFPTLRFIDASRLLPTKRSRIQDPLLLAVRVAIVALAAIALAQPLLLTRSRQQSLDRGLARAIIVDTSASVRRIAIDTVRAMVRQLASESQASIIVETDDPTGALPGAAAWVAKQRRRGEIAVVSDFQRGQIEQDELAAIPATIGIVLRRIQPPSSSEASTVHVIAGGRAQTASAAVTPNGVDVTWSGSRDSAVRVPVELYAGRDDAAALIAVQFAAATLAIPLPIDTTRSIAIVFARYTARDSVLNALETARAPWKLALLADVRRAGLSISAAGDAVVAGRKQFVLATNAEPTSVDAAQLVSLARRSTSDAAPPTELEPAVVSDSELRTWERAAVLSTTARGSSNENGPSDGRWVWALVLALLVVEWRLRRHPTGAAVAITERARAA